MLNEKYAKANFINIFDQIKDEEKPRYYSEFQYILAMRKILLIQKNIRRFYIW